MNFPDRIFALGGAGKSIAYELLESEWIQESILEPQPEPEELVVTIIDTAEEERNRDLQRINGIESAIQKKENELRDPSSGRTGTIEIEYLPLTKQIQLHDQNDLIGEDTVPRIASGTGMEEENWWLKPELIDEDLDFTTGVVRRRGLGKALYYKAYAEVEDVRTAIDLPNRGRVAVFAGLGGGTGSGILLDLAADLKQTQRSAEITLFGILPNDDEPTAENANAHAVLSEMEYAALNGESLFNDRILIPINPTNFSGKTQNILESSGALKELDQAIVYLIVAYYNMMDMEDPFADIPSYAPFTIGLPQVLRYNVDAINEAKSSLSKILDAKDDATEAEADIYAEVDRFLTKQRYDNAEGELHDIDRSDLENRLSRLQSLIEFDLLDELEYESVSVYRGIIDDAERETDDITERIEVIMNSIRAGTADVDTEDRYVDSIDRRLFDIIKQELSNIHRRQEIIKNARAVEEKNNRVGSTLSYLIGLEDEGASAGVRLKKLETKLEDAEERRDRLQSELEDVREELAERREEQKEELNRVVENWRRDTEHLYQELRRCRGMSIETLADQLETELNQYANGIEKAETEDDVEAANQNEVRRALNTIESEFEGIGVEITEDKRRINDVLDGLQSLKKSFLKMNADEGFVEKLSPFQTSKEEERENAQRNYRMKRAEINDSGVFTVSRTGDTLNVEFEYSADSFRNTLERETREREEQILDEVRARIDGSSDTAVDRVRKEIQRDTGMEALTGTVREILEAEIIQTDDIEARETQLTDDIEAATDDVELYSDIVSLFQDINNRREAFIDAQEEYTDLRNEYGESKEVRADTEREDYLYVKAIKPHDVLQLRDDSSLEQSKLLEDRVERQRLRGSLEELARKAQDPKYNGIRKRRLSSDRSRYTHMKIVVGVISQVIDQIQSEADLRSEFQGSYNLGPGGENFASFPVTDGDSWDIGLGMFIGGVFLDNIRSEVESDGYFTGYETREATDDTDILIHHTYGLEDGFYIKRNEVLNMENPTDREFYLQDDSEITERLLEEYTSKTAVNDGSVSEPTGSSDGI